jgi:hypothetical protein
MAALEAMPKVWDRLKALHARDEHLTESDFLHDDLRGNLPSTVGTPQYATDFVYVPITLERVCCGARLLPGLAWSISLDRPCAHSFSSLHQPHTITHPMPASLNVTYPLNLNSSTSRTPAFTLIYASPDCCVFPHPLVSRWLVSLFACAPQLMVVGQVICLDAFLYIPTALPIRFLIALCTLLGSFVNQRFASGVASCVHPCVRPCTRVCIRAYIGACIRVCIRVCVCVCVCVWIHALKKHV